MLLHCKKTEVVNPTTSPLKLKRTLTIPPAQRTEKPQDGHHSPTKFPPLGSICEYIHLDYTHNLRPYLICSTPHFPFKNILPPAISNLCSLSPRQQPLTAQHASHARPYRRLGNHNHNHNNPYPPDHRPPHFFTVLITTQRPSAAAADKPHRSSTRGSGPYYRDGHADDDADRAPVRGDGDRDRDGVCRHWHRNRDRNGGGDGDAVGRVCLACCDGRGSTGWC